MGAYAREWVMLPNDHARNPTHTMPPTRVQLADRAFCYSRLECGSTSHHHKVVTISVPPTPIIKLQCARAQTCAFKTPFARPAFHFPYADG